MHTCARNEVHIFPHPYTKGQTPFIDKEKMSYVCLVVWGLMACQPSCVIYCQIKFIDINLKYMICNQIFEFGCLGFMAYQPLWVVVGYHPPFSTQ